uniref:Putative ovule protein n=1 Tax=Solanum chacoense TaxID=4108 RepID=A0A0V0I880_SOLCH
MHMDRRKVMTIELQHHLYSCSLVSRPRSHSFSLFGISSISIRYASLVAASILLELLHKIR